MGFPFEAIKTAHDRNLLMSQMLLYLRTTRLPLQSQPAMSVKFDSNYRFPTGKPSSKDNLEIEL